MSSLYEQHRETLEAALSAIRERGFWSPYPEVPSGKIYGEEAKRLGLEAYEAVLGKDFDLPGHPEDSRAGAEVSPFGGVADGALGIRYPAAGADLLVSRSQAAGVAWGAATAETRAGVCLEILARLNRRSFEMANATMHTSGQAFPMAFQAGGPHAQDRGLEALATAWAEMARIPDSAKWIKPQGKAGDLVMEKHWRIVPRGVSLLIGCQTFPTWNSYAGLFASLVTGNTVIAKPHPAAILPMALTVKVAREVLAEQGLPADAVLLAAENPGGVLARDLASHAGVALVDYTGSGEFGRWLRSHAATPLVFTEEAGVNSIVLASTDDFNAMCQNIAFSLSLYSGQMCTAPQNLFVPRDGMLAEGRKISFDEVAQGIAAAVDALLADPARAAAVAGAIANPATLERVAAARGLGRVMRDSSVLAEAGAARTATPLIVAIDAADETAAAAFEAERFGPIAFVIAVDDAAEGVRRAASLARSKGAITAALYDTDEAGIHAAVDAFAAAGVNLSVNLLGGIYVNQSAAFSDFHVTGANPAGNACFSDAAFVANRFRVVMWRRPARS